MHSLFIQLHCIFGHGTADYTLLYYFSTLCLFFITHFAKGSRLTFMGSLNVSFSSCQLIKVMINLQEIVKGNMLFSMGNMCTLLML